jgi:hypothetical protein
MGTILYLGTIFKWQCYQKIHSSLIMVGVEGGGELYRCVGLLLGNWWASASASLALTAKGNGN